MIFSIRGRIILKNYESSSVVIETGEGIGYEVYVTPSAARNIPPENSRTEEVTLYISESSSLYGGGGGTTLYGFETMIDREIFELLRSMPSTGAKKALEYLEKIKRSPSEFRDAVILRDTAKLSTLFGFRKPTAEKFIANLRDRVMEMDFSKPSVKGFPSRGNFATSSAESSVVESEGSIKRAGSSQISGGDNIPLITAEIFSESLAVLVALGYREQVARDAIDEALRTLSSLSSAGEKTKAKTTIDAQTLVKAALKKL